MRINTLPLLCILLCAALAFGQTSYTSGQIASISITSPSISTNIYLNLTAESSSLDTYDVAITAVPVGANSSVLTLAACGGLNPTCSVPNALWVSDGTGSLVIPSSDSNFVATGYTIVVSSSVATTVSVLATATRALTPDCTRSSASMPAATTSGTPTPTSTCFSFPVTDPTNDIRIALYTTTALPDGTFYFPDLVVALNAPNPSTYLNSWQWYFDGGDTAGNGDKNAQFVGIDNADPSYGLGTYYVCAESGAIAADFQIYVLTIPTLDNSTSNVLTTSTEGLASSLFSVPYDSFDSYYEAITVQCPQGSSCNIYVSSTINTCTPTFATNDYMCTDCDSIFIRPRNILDSVYGDYVVTVETSPLMQISALANPISVWSKEFTQTTFFDNPIGQGQWEYYDIYMCNPGTVFKYNLMSQGGASMYVSYAQDRLPTIARADFTSSVDGAYSVNTTTQGIAVPAHFVAGVHSTQPTTYSVAFTAYVPPKILTDQHQVKDACSCEYNYYQVNIDSPGADFVVNFATTRRQNMGLFVSTVNENPSISSFDYFTKNQLFFDTRMTAANPTATSYYIGLRDCKGSVTITPSIATSLDFTSKMTSSVKAFSYKYFVVTIAKEELIQINVKLPPGIDMALKGVTIFASDAASDLRPTASSYQFMSTTGSLLVLPTQQKYEPGAWHIGVYANEDTQFEIRVLHYAAPPGVNFTFPISVSVSIGVSVVGFAALVFCTWFNKEIRKKMDVAAFAIEHSY